jgi:hypothetical protein
VNVRNVPLDEGDPLPLIQTCSSWSPSRRVVCPMLAWHSRPATGGPFELFMPESARALIAEARAGRGPAATWLTSRGPGWERPQSQSVSFEPEARTAVTRPESWHLRFGGAYVSCLCGVGLLAFEEGRVAGAGRAGTGACVDEGLDDSKAAVALRALRT